MKSAFIGIATLLLVSSACSKTYAQIDTLGTDTVYITKTTGEVFEVTAPQKYYAHYEWTLHDNTQINGQTIQLSYNGDGNYLVSCRAYEDCDAEKISIVSITITPSEESNSDIYYSTLYPNPVSSSGPYLNVTSTVNNLNASILITSVGGTSIYSSNVSLVQGNNLFDLTTAVQNASGTLTLIFTAGSYSRNFTFYKQ